jgi:hypothetical protein
VHRAARWTRRYTYNCKEKNHASYLLLPSVITLQQLLLMLLEPEEWTVS